MRDLKIKLRKSHFTLQKAVRMMFDDRSENGVRMTINYRP